MFNFIVFLIITTMLVVLVTQYVVDGEIVREDRQIIQDFQP